MEFQEQNLTPQERIWQPWLERLYNLRRDKTGDHERPHKPILLLSIIDLLDRGVIRKNEIPLSEELVETFKRYFDVVRKQNDQPTIQNPYFHLSGDGFWRLVPAPRQPEIYRAGEVSGAPSVAQLRRSVAFGKFDGKLWDLLKQDYSRHQLREAIISRYFPDERTRLAALIAANTRQPEEMVLKEPPPPGRDAAFRRTILEIYDYTCSACGIRLMLTEQLSLVEAAHIIPFGISRNDKPTNGLALCPNHHWAMDRHLISPCPDKEHVAGVWRVNPRLDSRWRARRIWQSSQESESYHRKKRSSSQNPKR